MCADRSTVRCHEGTGWRVFEGFVSSGFGAGPWRSHSGRKEIQKTDRRCELVLSVSDPNKKRVKHSGNFTSLQDALQAFFGANSQR